MRKYMRGWPSAGETAPDPSQATRVVVTLNTSGGGNAFVTLRHLGARASRDKRL